VKMPVNQKNDQDHLQNILLDLLREPANKECADCGAKGPRWASASIGVFVCIKCSGIHRSLGTHISFVRSVTLDKWTPEQVKNMQEVGNAKAKEIYEALIPDNYRRPNENDGYALEQFIRAKYDRKEFMNKEGKTKPTKKSTRVSKTEPSPSQQERASIASKAPSVDLMAMDNGPSQAQGFDFAGFQGGSSTSGFQSASTPAFQGASSGFQAFQGSSTPSAFQGASSSFQGFQGASTPQASDLFNGANFVGASPSIQSVPKFDSESAFFSGDNQNQVKPSKQSILDLYKAPGNAPTNALPVSFTQPLQNSAPLKPNGPNYNIVMPGIGMPVGPVNPPHAAMPHPSYQMGGMPVPTANYYPQGAQAANFVGYRPAPANNTGPFVNTNGYVNANYQAAQSQGGLKFM